MPEAFLLRLAAPAARLAKHGTSSGVSAVRAHLYEHDFQWVNIDAVIKVVLDWVQASITV